MSVHIELDNETPLVLFEPLKSREDLPEVLKLEAPERNALWSLEAALEREVVEPFSPNYEAILSNARNALVNRG